VTTVFQLFCDTRLIIDRGKSQRLIHVYDHILFMKLLFISKYRASSMFLDQTSSILASDLDPYCFLFGVKLCMSGTLASI